MQNDNGLQLEPLQNQAPDHERPEIYTLPQKYHLKISGNMSHQSRRPFSLSKYLTKWIHTALTSSDLINGRENVGGSKLSEDLSPNTIEHIRAVAGLLSGEMTDSR